MTPPPTIKMAIALGSALLLTLAPVPGRAHAIKIFAAATEGAIHGSVYFPGGAVLPEAVVMAYGPDGRLVARTETDGDVRFVLPPNAPPLRLVTETPDGHRAEFTFAAGEWAPGTTTTGPEQPSPESGPLAAALPAGEELAQLVEQAVARQLHPLREQLDREAQRKRLQDVLGGLGYILGLAGLVLYGMANKKSRE